MSPSGLPALVSVHAGLSDQVAGGALPLAVLVAALAGLVSFVTPCVIPLVPGYLGYVTGLSDVALQERSRGRMIAGALLFILGRVANAEVGDVLWVPGKDRAPVGERAERQRAKIEAAQSKLDATPQEGQR